MTSETITLDALQERAFPKQRTICSFGPRIVFSALHGRQYWIVVMNEPASEALVCEYDDPKEWRTEIAVLRRAAQNGGDTLPPDMGVTANLPPPPPSRPAANSHALPVDL